MVDYSELKKLAEDAVIFAGINGEISYAQEQFIAAANPAAVLVLLDDLESAQKKIDKAWNRSTPALDGCIPGAMDAWKRPVKQHLPYDFSGNPGTSATQYCNGWNDSGGYWKNHCLDLQAQIAGLKTGYEAFEQVNAGLKAEAAAISPEVKAMLDKMEADEQAMFCLAATFVRKTGRASISALQRNFKLSYGSACRLMDGLVVRGVVTPIDSEGRRTVLPVSVPIDDAMSKGEQS